MTTTRSLCRMIDLGPIQLYLLGGHQSAGSASSILVVKGNSAIMIDFGLNMNLMSQNNVDISLLKSADGLNIESIIANEDQYYPDLELLNDLLDNGLKLEAVLVSHAHFDHFGGIHRLLRIMARRQSKIVVAGSRYTLRIIADYLTEGCAYDYDELELEAGEIDLNGWKIHSYQTFHSVMGSLGFAIEYAKDEAILFTGDFKSRLMSEGDLETTERRLGNLLANGMSIKLAITDGTNAARSGWVNTEWDVSDAICSIVDQVPGRVLASFFASNMTRLTSLLLSTWDSGGAIGIAGASFETHVSAMIHSTKAPISLVRPTEANILAVTGCQGEANAVLSRLSHGKIHHGIRLLQNDTLVLSSRPIPGQPDQQEEIRQMLGRIESMCSRVYVDIAVPDNFPGIRIPNLHTSGHGYDEDIAYTLNLVRPERVLAYHCDQNAALALEEIARAHQATIATTTQI